MSLSAPADLADRAKDGQSEMFGASLFGAHTSNQFGAKLEGFFAVKCCLASSWVSVQEQSK